MLDHPLRACIPLCCLLLVGGWLLPAGADTGAVASEQVFDPAMVLAGIEDVTISENLDAGTDPGDPAGFIVGRVWSGLDPEHARPLPAAQIWLFRATPNGLELFTLTHSGHEGQYLFGPIPPGGYLLVASAPRHLPAAAPVEVEPGEETVHSFHLRRLPPPAPGAIVGRVFGASPDGDPIPLAGAAVRVLGPDGFHRRVFTNEEGFYGIDDVPAGHYLMRAWAQGYQAARAVVHVHPNQVTLRRFLLRPAGGTEHGAIAGHVFGITSGGDEVPLAGAVVRLFRPGGPVREVFTNNQGQYLMRGVPAGEYGMMADAEGFEPQEASVAVEPNQVAEVDFLLHPGGEPELGAIAGRVFGIIPDGSEVPLAGAVVRLFRPGGLIREAFTNDQGQYVMEEVPAGLYGMMANAEGFRPQGAFVVVEPDQVTEQDFLLHPIIIPIGACCIEDMCIMLPEQRCIEEGGVYQGDGVSCADDPC